MSQVTHKFSTLIAYFLKLFKKKIKLVTFFNIKYKVNVNRIKNRYLCTSPYFNPIFLTNNLIFFIKTHNWLGIINTKHLYVDANLIWNTQKMSIVTVTLKVNGHVLQAYGMQSNSFCSKSHDGWSISNLEKKI